MLVQESLNTNFVAFKLDAEVNIAAQSISSGGFSLIKDLGGTDQTLVYGMDYNEFFTRITLVGAEDIDGTSKSWIVTVNALTLETQKSIEIAESDAIYSVVEINSEWTVLGGTITTANDVAFIYKWQATMDSEQFPSFTINDYGYSSADDTGFAIVNYDTSSFQSLSVSPDGDDSFTSVS